MSITQILSKKAKDLTPNDIFDLTTHIGLAMAFLADSHRSNDFDPLADELEKMINTLLKHQQVLGNYKYKK